MTAKDKRSEISHASRALLEASPDPIVIYDMDGKAQYINSAFTQTFGWEADELLGRRIDFVPEERLAETRAAITQMLRGEKVKLFATKRLTKSGKLLDIQLSTALFQNEAGEAAGNIVILSDVSELQRYQQALKRSHDDLELQVEKRTAELLEANRHLEGQIRERRRAEKINRTLFRISNAVNTTANLDELYGTIHQSLGEIIDLTNFYIAIYHKGDNRLEFPYFVDQYDQHYEYVENFTETNSLTGEVILSGKPVFQTSEILKQRYIDGRILGTLPKIWIGVPLKTKNEVIGVMATQSYDDPNHFDSMDVDILGSISDQVAIAIERKRVMQALIESEEKYRSILENIEDGYYEVDLEGNFTFFNDSMSKILRYPRAELMGMNNRDYMDADNARKIYATFNRVYCTGLANKALDWRLIRKDNTPCYVETVVSLIKDAHNQPVGFRGIARDVTARKKAEAERLALEEQLQQSQKLEALGKLAGGIAHDFNNLLMGIQGRTSLILANSLGSAAHHGQLKAIEEYVKSAAGLTRRLLDFARGGKYEVVPIDLNQLVEKCWQMFGRTRKEITIQTRFAPSLATIEADMHQMEQVLLNLFVNAWQAMPGGGHLSIETRNVTLNPMEAETLEILPGEYVAMTVADTGIGMDNETCRKVFDPFFTTKDIGHGTGLGLASAYGIIRNHHGAITVSSEKGCGTTFHIYLPASSQKAAVDNPETTQLVRGSGTVLLVDDEEIIIEVGREILESLGYRVLTAETGPEALRLFKEEKDGIDLVILDMIMPGMGGGEVFDQMHKLDDSIKVLLSSGYSIDGQANEIIKRGCHGFIQKPFDLKKLSAKIRQIVEN